MKTAILLSLVLAPIVLIGSAVIYCVSVYNDNIAQEQGIVATNEDMKNVDASVFNTIKSQGLTVEKYGDLVIKAIEASTSGRYGKNGSQAAMQWIQEQNQNIDAKIMDKLQIAIEAGYNKFESAQRTKIDRIRIYNIDLKSVIRGSASWVMGFPKIDLKDLSQTIVTAETKKTFETKEKATIDPFAK